MPTPYYLRRPELDDEESIAKLSGEDDFPEPMPAPVATPEPDALEALARYAKPRAPAGSGVAELEAAQGEDRRQAGRDRLSEALYAAGMRQPARLSSGPGKADELLQRRALASQEQATSRQGFRDELALLQAKAKLQPAKSTGDDDYKRAMAERLRALTEREKATTALKTEQSEQDDAEIEADRASLGKLFPGHDLSKMSRKGIDALMKQLNLSEAQKQRLREKAAGAASARTKAEAKEARAQAKLDAKRTEGLPPGYEAAGNPTDDDKKKFKAALSSRERMSGLVAEMRRSLSTAGAADRLIPGVEKDRLRQLSTAIQMEAKNIAELGALSGPDLALMQSLAPDPTTIGSTLRGNETAMLDGLQKWADNALGAVSTSTGIRKAGSGVAEARATMPHAPAGDLVLGDEPPMPPGAVRAQRNKATGEVRYLDENGQVLK